MDCSTLAQYRLGTFNCFSLAKDALMDVADALLTETRAQTFVELSLAACFRRSWHSLYEAFQDGKIDRTKLKRLHIQYAPISKNRNILIGDASSMPRPHSKTGRDRGYVHMSNLPEGTKPVIAGWQFSNLVVAPEVTSSWTYTLSSERIPTDKTPCEMMAEQLSEAVPHIDHRCLFLGDGGYGNIKFLISTKEIECDKLLRFGSNRNLYREAEPRPEKPGPGRPSEDGKEFKCKFPETHGVPAEHWDGLDEKEKKIEVDRWDNLHFKEDRSIIVSLLRVTRHGAEGTKRDPKVVWFIFHGKECPQLSEIPLIYSLRYSIEHGFRFEKQDLMWCSVRLHDPDRMQLWTDIVGCVRNQLYLARSCGAVAHQPWENKALPATPQQVRRGMARIIAMLGTPARPPQLRGKSPGLKKGSKNKPAKTYKVVYKSQKPSEEEKKAA